GSCAAGRCSADSALPERTGLAGCGSVGSLASVWAVSEHSAVTGLEAVAALRGGASGRLGWPSGCSGDGRSAGSRLVWRERAGVTEAAEEGSGARQDSDDGEGEAEEEDLAREIGRPLGTSWRLTAWTGSSRSRCGGRHAIVGQPVVGASASVVGCQVRPVEPQ